MLFTTFLLLAASLRINSVTGADPPGGYYTTRYDQFDVENILNHKRLVHYYAACLLDRGPCTPQGTEFKNILPDAIKTNCLRCTEKQRSVTVRTIRRLQKEYPDIWGQLEKRWDPSGENVKKLLLSVNRPKPVAETTPSVFNRFGDDAAEANQDKVVLTPQGTSVAPPITPRLTTTTSATASITVSTTPSTTRLPLTRKPLTITTTSPIIIALSTTPSVPPCATAKSTTQTITTSRGTKRPSGPRPFNSIGPNLVVINPKILIDKVFFTADMLLKTVTGVLGR